MTVTAINLIVSESQFRRSIQARFAEPVLFPTYTVGTLPTASDWTGCGIYVSDGTSNKRFAISDGTNWRWPDGNIVT